MSIQAQSETIGDDSSTIGSGVGTMERELSAMGFDPSCPTPTTFQLRAALPKQGRGQAIMAATDRMWVNLKVYASGGENELHAHMNEDHVFIILQGAAIFRAPDGGTTRLTRNYGLMLPRGTTYSFTADEAEPLVLLRVGAVVDPEKSAWSRTDASGKPLAGNAVENKAVPTVFYTDRFYE